MDVTIETQMQDQSSPVIAIVDDDQEVRETLCELLSSSGFTPIACEGSADFHALGEPPAVDLAIIDLRLRGESGLDLAVQIGARHALPVVMLTGVGDEIDQIIGLETGADDYLMKPFNPRELVARIRSVLRRYGHGGKRAMPLPEHTIVFGRKQLDLQSRILLDHEGHEIPLTNGEYRLLEYFARNPSRVIARPELLSELGSDMERYVDRTIDVLILRLRRKIEDTPSKPVHLQTRRSQGYFFMLEVE
jgi:two-component system OmpR family response regulator/two-component system phosphate regulon response regulator OmpR